MRIIVLFCVALIFSLGLMMVFDTTSAAVLDRSLDKSLYQALLRQLTYAGIGCLAGVVVWRIGYEHLLKLSPFLLAIGILCLVLVFFPKIGSPRGGARRWISVGHFSFQPSEFVKYLILMVYIEWAMTKKKILFFSFGKMTLVILTPVFLIMLEPDNGTAAVMVLSLTPLFFITRIPLKYWALPILIFSVAGGAVAWNLPYVRARIQVYLHPERDLQGKGHQPRQSKIAVGSGQLLGKGAGASLQKLTYLPEAQNDYIAAIYAEEFGFLGMIVLILAYMVFAFCGFSISMNAMDQGGRWLGAGVTFLIGLQAFLNLGVVSGLLPSKGVNLPFFSQGGTSLIANMIGIALLMDIGTRQYDEKKSFI